MDEQNEKTPEELEVAQQAEYEEGWKADEAREAAAEGKGHEEEGLSGKQTPPETESEPEGDAGKEPESEPRSKTFGSIDAMEKAVKDSQAAVTRLAQEKAELERRLKAVEDGKGSQAEVEAQKKAVSAAIADFDSIVNNASKVYEDYPELKNVLDPIINATKGLATELTTLRSKTAEDSAKDARQKAIDDFNTNVKPEVLKEHPDFDEIIMKQDGSGRLVANEEYFSWAEKQRPSLKTAALASNDPEDIKFAVREFKKFKAQDAASDTAAKEQAEREKKLKNLQTTRAGGTHPALPGTKFGADRHKEYDAGWDAAGKALKAQGLE